MKEAPHEKMTRDETEYAERGAHAYAACPSQRGGDDETELRGAFIAGFKSACAYLRAPGISRAMIVEAPLPERAAEAAIHSSTQEEINQRNQELWATVPADLECLAAQCCDAFHDKEAAAFQNIDDAKRQQWREFAKFVWGLGARPQHGRSCTRSCTRIK